MVFEQIISTNKHDNTYLKSWPEDTLIDIVSLSWLTNIKTKWKPIFDNVFLANKMKIHMFQKFGGKNYSKYYISSLTTSAWNCPGVCLFFVALHTGMTPEQQEKRRLRRMGESRQYRIKCKDEVASRRNEQVTCECGSGVTHRHLVDRTTTTRHQKQLSGKHGHQQNTQ